MKKKVIKPKFVTETNEEIIIGGCVFTPVTEKIYEKDIDDKYLSRWDGKEQSFISMGLEEKGSEQGPYFFHNPSTWNEPNENIPVPNVTPDEEHQRKATIVNTLIVNAFRLDIEAFGWLMDKLNQRKVKSKMLEGILEELLAEEKGVSSGVNAVDVRDIKSVFEKYGIINKAKF